MITINNISLSSLGVTLLKGAYPALLAPAPIKELIENDDPTQHGTQVLTRKKDGSSIIRLAERDVTLTFLVQGKDEADYLAKYRAFIEMLQADKVVLHIPDLGESFTLIYRNATQFDNYRRNACSLAIKFREPNPAER